MSSVLKTTRYAGKLEFVPMNVQDVEEVVLVEDNAYPFPWTRGNFLDSLANRYDAWVLREDDGRLAGYFLVMSAVDDMHLLNITVRPDLQGQGIGRYLLDKVCALAQSVGIHQILLEVRPSNQHALAVYRHAGFQMIGTRKKYYPAAGGSREDAIVMRLKLVQESA
jgi:ribosomal-protein-alanine N-acetyltransferase